MLRFHGIQHARLPVLHSLPEFAQTHVRWVSDAIQPCHPVLSPSLLHSSFPVSESFPVRWLFKSGAQNIRASASVSVLPVCCYFSVAPSYPTLYDPMDWSTPGLTVSHQIPKFAQVHVHCISDAVQLSYPLTPSSPLALNLSQHLGLIHWVSCSHQMTKILQLQHHSFQQVFRVDFP